MNKEDFLAGKHFKRFAFSTLTWFYDGLGLCWFSPTQLTPKREYTINAVYDDCIEIYVSGFNKSYVEIELFQNLFLVSEVAVKEVCND